VESCQLIFVQDWGQADSQFVVIDLHTLTTSEIGRRYDGVDIEGIAMQAGVLYATGRGSNHIKVLYTVDSHTGALTPIGSTGFRDLDALAFRFTDNTLWSWAKGTGLVTLDLTTGAGTVVLASELEIEGLTWSNDGTLLYGAVGTQLWVYDPGDNRLTRLADNLPGITEGLEMTSKGVLLGSTHKGGAISIFTYNLETLQPVASLSVPPYDDIESLIWPACGSLQDLPWAPIDTSVPPSGTPSSDDEE
jgi:hypothetical protein